MVHQGDRVGSQKFVLCIHTDRNKPSVWVENADFQVLRAPLLLKNFFNFLLKIVLEKMRPL